MRISHKFQICQLLKVLQVSNLDQSYMLHTVPMVRALGGIFYFEVPSYHTKTYKRLVWRNTTFCGTTCHHVSFQEPQFYGPQHNVTALTQHQLTYHFVQTGQSVHTEGLISPDSVLVMWIQMGMVTLKQRLMTKQWRVTSKQLPTACMQSITIKLWPYM